jgi:hypothetical protein
VSPRVAAALLGIAGLPAWGCDIELAGSDVMRLESERYVVALRNRSGPIAVGEHFALDVAACAKNGATTPELLRVDARMPAHRHGMNYVPRVRATAPGRWQADGLMFHMPGLWEFRIDLRAGGVTDRLTYDYQLD